jgi:diadenosine tetraphosphate (Ap4A) HIT family hydrolase
MGAPACPLCETAGGQGVFAGDAFRVVRTDEGGFPAFYRVVWNRHVAELSDLDPADQALCLQAVVVVEQALRAHLQPAKVNLASLGNLVPHLHWHVVARFEWDSHFPAPVWAAPHRQPDVAGIERVLAHRALLESDMARQLSTLDRGNLPD